MANIKSQKKRIKTNEKRRVRNQAYKSELKTLVRKTREAIATGDAEAATDAQGCQPQAGQGCFEGYYPQEPGC